MNNNIIIIGAGGLASDMISYLENTSQLVKGILCDDKSDYDNLNSKINYLGEIDSYKININDSFIVAIGKNPDRLKVIENFETKGANFYTFTHPTAIICNNVEIGNGVIIGPYSTIGSNSRIDDGCFLNKYCSIGHDSIIEKNSIIYPFGLVGGKCHIKKNSTLSTRSSVLPGVFIGSDCLISAHCVVRKNVNNGTLYFSEKLSTKNKNF
jgi:sugar O-acyltransferase (sialic acid O-acetyltransferase NeuD family)